LTSSEDKIHVIVIGAGFGGIHAVRVLSSDPSMRVTVIDRHNYHLFQPLLYQVAIAGLEAPEIAEPVRSMLRKHRSARFLLGTVTSIDRSAQTVSVDGRMLRYDYLIVSSGSRSSQPPVPGVPEHTISMKDLPDALAIRDRILAACEEASRERDPERQRNLVHFIMVGGGPTGVELAGMLAEFGRRVVPRDYPEIPEGAFRVSLVDSNPLPLSSLSKKSQRYARQALTKLGVALYLNARVDAVTAGGVRLTDGGFIPGFTTFWTAGVEGALIDGLPMAGRGGRLVTTPELHLPDDPRVYVIGDLNALPDPRTARPFPQVAQVAMQQGRLAAANIILAHRYGVTGTSQQQFKYRDLGNVATIGRNRAVVELGPLKLTGFPAWVGWAGLHIVQLVGFRNRVLVMSNWIFNYVAYEFGVRIMYRKPVFPGD
jgi:NADH dehydrogenase